MGRMPGMTNRPRASRAVSEGDRGYVVGLGHSGRCVPSGTAGLAQ